MGGKGKGEFKNCQRGIRIKEGLGKQSEKGGGGKGNFDLKITYLILQNTLLTKRRKEIGKNKEIWLKKGKIRARKRRA